jgi:hypothetical protein
MKILFAGCLLFVFVSCKDKQPEAVAPAQTSDTTSKTYFPVYHFIKGEIRAVDSLPIALKQYVTANGRTDSAYIDNKAFHVLADEFTSEELQDPQFRTLYAEQSFFDRSNRMSTFMYTARNKDLPIQRIDVITAPTDTYDKVNSVYIEKTSRHENGMSTKKLIWKPGSHLQIITDQPAPARVIRVVWDY